LEQYVDVITVPSQFVASTVAREGLPGQRWIRRLPALVEELCAEWSLVRTGAALHGFVAIVVPVRQLDGTDAMLKVSWIDEESRDEAVALAAWAGRGAVQLLAADPERGALLVERLDPTTSLDGLPLDEAVDVAGRLLARLRTPGVPRLRTTSSLAQRWQAEFPRMWKELGGPGERRLIDAAVRACNDLADARESFVVHGDFHYDNVLFGVRLGWTAIDPKPLNGDREYELLPLLRNRFGAVRPRLRRLAEVAGLDLGCAEAWALCRTVDDALWFHEHQAPEDAATAWEIAQALA
jgi:streptomycin 6-kinase